MNKNAKILIVGHNDIIERSLFSYFQANEYQHVTSSSDIGLNATIQASVYEFFQTNRPEYVFLGSTKSGGIQANIDYPAEFAYDNIQSASNVIYAAHKFQARKLLYFASSCVYPKDCAQPMSEDKIGTGEMEETSLPYATAKLAGIQLCQSYRKQYGFSAIVAVPATVYGPQSDTNAQTAHVIGALVGKFKEAVSQNKDVVEIWGSGNPGREFLYSDDFVQASLFLMDRYESDEVVNIGVGTDVSIKELAELIAQEVGFKGVLSFDTSKPDGVMQKLLDNGRLLKLGWKSKVSLKEGIQKSLRELTGV